MIAKVKKGALFGGCVRYVMNESAEVLAVEGVDAEDAATITRDFAIQRSVRPEIKQPVGHIAVSFSPDDSPRMTDEFMLTLAHEYMAEMGVENTQFIVVRHHNTDHDHFHIVYNRIDNDLKLISANNDFHRSGAACKWLKDRHGLTFGVGKERVNRERLTGADRVKYRIHDEIAACLPHCAGYADLEKRLRQAGITVQYKYRRGTSKSPENVQGISFAKGDYSFKGSQIDRAFSHAGLSKAFGENMDATVREFLSGDGPTKQQPEQATAPTFAPSPQSQPQSQQSPVPEKSREPEPTTPPRQADPEAVKREIHAAITANLRDCVLLFDLGKRLQDAGITMLLKYRSGALHSPENVQGVSFEKNGLTFKGSEIDRSFSHANLTQTLNQNWDKWFKTNVAPDEPTAPTVKGKAMPPVVPPQERREQSSPERPAPDPPKPLLSEPLSYTLNGIDITAAQWETLQSGGHIWLENMNREDGSGRFSAYVFMDDDKKEVLHCATPPDTMIENNGFALRARDIAVIQQGSVAHAEMKLRGESESRRRFAWYDTKADGIMYSDYDPRLPIPPMVIRGVEITAEQENTLYDGGYIFLKGMERKDGSGKYDGYVFLSDDKNRWFSCKTNPDEFVKFGAYEMRLRDKRQIEQGLPTRAVIRLPGGELAGARLCKEKPEDAGYNVSWDDSHIAKEQREREKRQSSDDLRRPLALSRIPPTENRTPPAVNRIPPTVDRTIIQPPSKGPKFRR